MTLAAGKVVEVFYDGDCPLCMREIRMLTRKDRAARIQGRLADGTWIDGVEVFRQLYAAIGWTRLVAVSRWPVIRTIAKLGRTVFVSRQRASTVKERDEMQARLAAGDGLILFPEGTTSDGARVLPFRTPFFAIAAHDPAPIIQPVSIVYDRLGGLPVGRVSRTAFSWYGDMDIAGHFAQFGQQRGMRASVVMHAPLDPRDFADRKALASEVWRIVADGAALLRQNRPVPS